MASRYRLLSRQLPLLLPTLPLPLLLRIRGPLGHMQTISQQAQAQAQVRVRTSRIQANDRLHLLSVDAIAN